MGSLGRKSPAGGPSVIISLEQEHKLQAKVDEAKLKSSLLMSDEKEPRQTT